jgi:hypothetical protein
VRDGIRHQVANDNDAGHGRHHLIIKRPSGRQGLELSRRYPASLQAVGDMKPD